MSKLVGKSGTGIRKSGTGIRKSGTGIRKSGTGWRLGGALVAAAFSVAAVATSQAVLADDSGLLVTYEQDTLMVSLHGDEGIVAGAAPLSGGTDGYFALVLHKVFDARAEVPSMGTLVRGSGSGSSDEGCVEAGELMVRGSGSGSSDEKVSTGGELMVRGSGSGNSDEAHDAHGDGLMVRGSGSGNSDESVSGCETAWGVAEVVVDAGGMNLLVHRIDEAGMSEFLVGHVAASDDNPRAAAENRFIARP